MPIYDSKLIELQITWIELAQNADISYPFLNSANMERAFLFVPLGPKV